MTPQEAPLQASSSVMSFTVRVGDQFKMLIVHLTPSDHKFLGTFFSISIALTKFITVRFLRSATPFCCGV